MKVIPSRARIVLWSAGVLLSLALVIAAYGYYQLSAGVDPPGLEAPNILDARESSRKIKLLDQALSASKHGFIRLSEVEINSYLHAHYPDPRTATNAPPDRDSCRLVKCCVDLVTGAVVFYSWVDLTWHGHTWTLCWQRAVQPRPQGDGWTFSLTAMHVGNLPIPPRFWGNVSEIFAGADAVFTRQYTWLTRLPAVVIQPSELDQAPELRLYTFRDPGLWRDAQR
ncbi:MAG: hypothetical protein KGS61_07985 [Verrucomicrobia bacterium]|nr:hypothetical protein [Verrucomicrobiota bacterium]